jgi:hypothetical protein
MVSRLSHTGRHVWQSKGIGPTAWYWNHGEEISENKRRHWMCTPCWDSKKFTNYTQTSNKAITEHLKDAHNIARNLPRLEITPTDDSVSLIIPNFLIGNFSSCG